MTFVLILLSLSLTLNVVFGWYLYKTVTNLLFMSDEMDELLERTEEFTGHLKLVYQLETFYGDEILHNLLRHSKNYERYLGSFKEIADLPKELEVENYEEEDDSDQEEETQTVKDVFYGGTRTSRN